MCRIVQWVGCVCDGWVLCVWWCVAVCVMAVYVQVKWSRENYHHSLSSPYSLRLASGDASGKIIVWDVVSGTAHCEIQEHSKPIPGESCSLVTLLHLSDVSPFFLKYISVPSILFFLHTFFSFPPLRPLPLPPLLFFPLGCRRILLSILAWGTCLWSEVLGLRSSFCGPRSLATFPCLYV